SAPTTTASAACPNSSRTCRAIRTSRKSCSIAATARRTSTKCWVATCCAHFARPRKWRRKSRTTKPNGRYLALLPHSIQRLPCLRRHRVVLIRGHVFVVLLRLRLVAELFVGLAEFVER